MFTLEQYVNRTARQLGDTAILTTTSAGANSSEAIFGALIRSGNDDEGATEYGGGWLYALDAPLAGQQREIRNAGYTRSTGRLRTVRGFTDTPGSGVRFRYYSRLPRINDAGQNSVVDAVNAALADLWVEDHITVLGTESGRIDAAEWQRWLTSDRRIGQVYRPREAGARRYEAQIGARVERTGSGIELALARPMYAGEEFEIQVWRPANTMLRLSGVWTEADEDDALTADADEALVPVELVWPVALWHCYEYLSHPAPGVTNEYWLAKQQGAERAKNRAIAASKPSVTRPVQPRVVGIGGASSGLEFR